MTGVAALTALALLVGGCGGGNGTDPSPSPTPEASQSASEPTSSETPSPTPTVEPTLLADLTGVEVDPDLTVQPAVTAPYPFKVDQTMTKVIVAGSGHGVPALDSTVQVQYVGINARTGEVFDASWLRDGPVMFQLNQLVQGFGAGVVGQPVGSRVAVAITSSEGYDPQGQPSIGIEPGDTLLFIVDILDSELGAPSGTPVTPPEGLPVVAEADGVPTITIPGGLPEPTAVQVQPLIQGSGRALGETDALLSHAVCVAWDGTEFYNDYDGPAAGDALQGDATHQGLFTALIGQQTGSRVLVMMPGSVAYPNGNRTPSLAPNTSIACVVDVLFTGVY